MVGSMAQYPGQASANHDLTWCSEEHYSTGRGQNRPLLSEGFSRPERRVHGLLGVMRRCTAQPLRRSCAEGACCVHWLWACGMGRHRLPLVAILYTNLRWGGGCDVARRSPTAQSRPVLDPSYLLLAGLVGVAGVKGPSPDGRLDTQEVCVPAAFIQGCFFPSPPPLGVVRMSSCHAMGGRRVCGGPHNRHTLVRAPRCLCNDTFPGSKIEGVYKLCGQACGAGLVPRGPIGCQRLHEGPLQPKRLRFDAYVGREWMLDSDPGPRSSAMPPPGAAAAPTAAGPCSRNLLQDCSVTPLNWLRPEQSRKVGPRGCMMMAGSNTQERAARTKPNT